MKVIWVRPDRPDDRPKLMEWLRHGESNYFDPDVLRYPQTQILVAHHDKPVVAVPIQTAFVMESLAVNPEASDHEVATGIREIVIQTALMGQLRGLGETYFFATNPRTTKFAEKYGWEPVPWQAYRLRNYRLGEQQDEQPTTQNLPPGDPGHKDGPNPV